MESFKRHRASAKLPPLPVAAKAGCRCPRARDAGQARARSGSLGSDRSAQAPRSDPDASTPSTGVYAPATRRRPTPSDEPRHGGSGGRHRRGRVLPPRQKSSPQSEYQRKLALSASSLERRPRVVRQVTEFTVRDAPQFPTSRRAVSARPCAHHEMCLPGGPLVPQSRHYGQALVGKSHERGLPYRRAARHGRERAPSSLQLVDRPGRDLGVAAASQRGRRRGAISNPSVHDPNTSGCTSLSNTTRFRTPGRRPPVGNHLPNGQQRGELVPTGSMMNDEIAARGLLPSAGRGDRHRRQGVGYQFVSTTRAGYRALLRWMRKLGDIRLVGVEGTGSYGKGLTRHLLEAGVDVAEVHRPDRSDRRRRAASPTPSTPRTSPTPPCPASAAAPRNHGRAPSRRCVCCTAPAARRSSSAAPSCKFCTI